MILIVLFLDSDIFVIMSSLSPLTNHSSLATPSNLGLVIILQPASLASTTTLQNVSKTFGKKTYCSYLDKTLSNSSGLPAETKS